MILKNEGRRKCFSIFAVKVICIQRNKTQVELACGVFYAKKTSGTVYILNSGSFRNNQW